MLHDESSGSGRDEAQKNSLGSTKKINRKYTKEDHRNRGFSLIELLTTVGIIGVLASVAIPAYNTYRQNAAEGAVDSETKHMEVAFSACIATGETFPTCAGNTINGAIARTCNEASLNASITPTVALDGKCNITKDKANTKVCFSSLKVTGGFGAIHCRAYDSATGLVTEESASGKLGTALSGPSGGCVDGECK